MSRLVLPLMLTLSLATPAFAQSPPVASMDNVAAFRASIAAVRFDAPTGAGESAGGARAPRREMGKGKRALLTAAAGFGGFFAGGYIGAAIDGDCGGCDDPGLKGALIGFPIGAAAAAITTWLLTGR